MGIGRAIAARLLADGAHVVGLDVAETALERTRGELGDGLEPVVGDVGDWSAHERAADAAERSGELRWWVNNAGLDWVGAAHELDAEHVDRGLRVLLHGAIYACAGAVRRMLPHRAGSIVNISSVQGVAAFPRYLVYDAAKPGVIMKPKSVAGHYD